LVVEQHLVSRWDESYPLVALYLNVAVAVAVHLVKLFLSDELITVDHAAVFDAAPLLFEDNLLALRTSWRDLDFVLIDSCGFYRNTGVALNAPVMLDLLNSFKTQV
jgi:hypothetical protein